MIYLLAEIGIWLLLAIFILVLVYIGHVKDEINAIKEVRDSIEWVDPEAAMKDDEYREVLIMCTDAECGDEK